MRKEGGEGERKVRDGEREGEEGYSTQYMSLLQLTLEELLIIGDNLQSVTHNNHTQHTH